MTGATSHAVATATPTCSSHCGTTLYETYVAGQEESGCVSRGGLIPGVDLGRFGRNV